MGTRAIRSYRHYWGGQSKPQVNSEINDAFELTPVISRRVYDYKAVNDFDCSSATLMHTNRDNQFSTLSQELRLGYTDIEFEDFKDAAGDYQGNKSTYSPEYTFSIGAHGTGYCRKSTLRP